MKSRHSKSGNQWTRVSIKDKKAGRIVLKREVRKNSARTDTMNYFAYASNLNRKQMAERCPDSKPRFMATLPNYKFIFTGWSRKRRGGVASIKPFKGDKVMGAVYEISDRCLRMLDRHEDYPISYNHLNVVVWTETGEPVEAVTYIKIDQSEETQPSPEYLAVIQQGYRDWQLV